MIFMITECRCGNKKTLGNETSKIEFSPWMVQVRTVGGKYCGGSIIANKFVVTAAHCVLNVQHAWIELGGFFPGDEREFNPVKRIIVHPGYNRTLHGNDIALLETWLPIDLNTYTPICLRRTKETYDRKVAQVVVYRDEIQRMLYAGVLPPASCRGDNSKKNKLCAVQFKPAGLKPVSFSFQEINQIYYAFNALRVIVEDL